MSRFYFILPLLAFLLPGSAGPAQGPVGAKNAKEALQPLNELIGRWKATGIPAGTQEDAQGGFWSETLSWAWKFQGQDAWLTVDFTNGKHFTKGELRYLPDKSHYQLTLHTPAKKTVTFTGPLEGRRLILVRDEAATKEKQQLVIRLLHPERFLYTYAVRGQGKTLFQKVYQVGATREGVAFAAGDGKPECVVSGGQGTIPVTFQGKTYYVCCGGCRDEFNDNPAKYVREYEQKKAKKKGN